MLKQLERGDDLCWLEVDWDFEQSDPPDIWANFIRKFDPPRQMAYCQKVVADVQAFGSQQLKIELKTKDVNGQDEWVRTETFVLKAGEFRTVVVDAPEYWGPFDLTEISFTIDRRCGNPMSGKYWIRNIRITGRPCLLDSSCGPDH